MLIGSEEMINILKGQQSLLKIFDFHLRFSYFEVFKLKSNVTSVLKTSVLKTNRK